MKLENILKKTGKLILIGAVVYLGIEFLRAYYDVLEEEGHFYKREMEGEEYPLFI